MTAAPDPDADFMTAPVLPDVPLEAELRRVTDRLRHMTLARLDECAGHVREVLSSIAGLTRAHDPSAPAPELIPQLSNTALADQVQVLSNDLIARTTADSVARQQLTGLLTELRRSLP